MATIQFNAYKIHEVREYWSDVEQKTVKGVTISFGIGAGPPYPSEEIEAKSLKEIAPAFDDYVERAKASGLQLQLSARVKVGRSPSGFDKANLRRNVNI